MKVKFRRGCQSDLEQVYDLHTRCFAGADHWYKSAIKHYLDKGIIVEIINKDLSKQVIGVLLQGSIIPCNPKMTTEPANIPEESNLFDYSSKQSLDIGYKEDHFEPVTSNGKIFFDNNLHLRDLYGIVMICVEPNYRGKGLAKKLIEKHIKDNSSKVVCLNTRRSNISAFMLYKLMGYEHIAYIKNKYFLPTEDSIFMIREPNQSTELSAKN